MKTFLATINSVNEPRSKASNHWLVPTYYSPPLDLREEEGLRGVSRSTQDFSGKEQFTDDMDTAQLFVNQCSLTGVPGPHLLDTRTKYQYDSTSYVVPQTYKLSKVLFIETNLRGIKKIRGKDMEMPEKWIPVRSADEMGRWRRRLLSLSQVDRGVLSVGVLVFFRYNL